MIKQSRLLFVTALCLCLLFILVFLMQVTGDLIRERRMQGYMEAAQRAALEFDVPLPMVLAVIRAESDFDAAAVSRAGACGLMQLMPETFCFLRDEVFLDDLQDSAIFSPPINIRYGTYYLSYLYRRFGNWYTALAAYNAGEGRVADWQKDSALSTDGQLCSIPFPETAAYVEKALHFFEIYRQEMKKEYNYEYE